MAKITTAFYENPPWLESMILLQQKMDSLTRPLLEMQPDYSALTKTIAAVVDSPAIRDLNKMADMFNGQSLTAIYRTQELAAKLDTSGMIAALRQYQVAMDSFAPVELQVQLSNRLQDWSRIMSKVTCQIKPLTDARIAELSRLSSLVEEYSIMDIEEEPVSLSEDEQKMVATEVEEVLLSEKNWEQRFAERIKHFSQTHPVIAWVLKNIFLVILLGAANEIISSAVAQALFPAKVYEDPSPSSQVVYHIEQNQTVIIVGEVPYYYEVVVDNESSGGGYTGYVSKRSICLTEN